MTARDRRPRLRSITVPSLVVHGDSDPMYPLPHGQDTADAIPGAELLVLPGMGHNLPPQLCPVIADAITRIAQHAAVTPGTPQRSSTMIASTGSGRRSAGAPSAVR